MLFLLLNLGKTRSAPMAEQQWAIALTRPEPAYLSQLTVDNYPGR